MAQSLKFTVTDPSGFYASPTTELVNFVKKFQSDVFLCYESKEVNLKSIMGVLSLGIPTRAEVVITVSGKDEGEAIVAIKDKLIELHISLFKSDEGIS